MRKKISAERRLYQLWCFVAASTPSTRRGRAGEAKTQFEYNQSFNRKENA
jgi:hypothetical protein